MKKLSVLLGFAGLTALSAVAVAHEGGGCDRGHEGGRQGLFRNADTDKDGKVTLAEALWAGKQRFDSKDANKDGALSKDEVKGRGERMFERIDANHDGKVTRAESETFVREVFTRFDKNKDGVLTQDEMPKGPPHGRGGEKHDQDHK